MLPFWARIGKNGMARRLAVNTRFFLWVPHCFSEKVKSPGERRNFVLKSKRSYCIFNIAFGNLKHLVLEFHHFRTYLFPASAMRKCSCVCSSTFPVTIPLMLQMPAAFCPYLLSTYLENQLLIRFHCLEAERAIAWFQCHPTHRNSASKINQNGNLHSRM